MIGQKKLLQKLNSYTLETLPQSILFIGEEGCGKHLFSKYLAKKLLTPLVEIENTITNENIIEFQQRTVDYFYLIDLSLFTEKQQNQFLKFIEEPSKTVHLILCAESEAGILPTVLNRCFKFYFEPYTKEELHKAASFTNEFIYECCTTPGQLADVDPDSIESMHTLCQNIIKLTAQANYSNMLANELKINYKEEYDKYDFRLFLAMLEKTAFNTYLEENDPAANTVYTTVNEYRQVLQQIKPIKENFMINLLTTIWERIHA